MKIKQSKIIHQKDISLCIEHNGVERRKRNIESAQKMNCLPEDFDIEAYLNKGAGKLKPIEYYDVIDLGGTKLEVIPMPGHTKGSIALYNKDKRLILVSDATCPFVWLFLKESEPVSVYLNSLREVLKLEFDNFLVGHGARMFPRQKMIDFYEVAKNINLEESVKVSFPNFDNANSYCYTKGVMYNQDHCGIVFDPNKL